MAVDDDGGIAVTVQPTVAVIDDVRRAREFYRYLQSRNLAQPNLHRRDSTPDLLHSDVESLSAALAPFCQLTALRCNVKKAMLNVMDRDVMYFLAEACRPTPNIHAAKMYDFVEDPILMSCSSVPLKGRICELTVRMENDESSKRAPMFVIPDLTKSQFSHMGIVTGPPYYRFYAGTPITTRGGINIGSLAIMDVAPRDGLTPAEEEFLGRTAEQIMTYLELNRHAIEGRQSRKMAKGLEMFITGKRSIEEDGTSILPGQSLKTRLSATYGIALKSDCESGATQETASIEGNYESQRSASESTETDDQQKHNGSDSDSRTHSKTFARAANLLRECLGDLGEDGSVIFMSLRNRLRNRAPHQPVPVQFFEGEISKVSSEAPDPVSQLNAHPVAVIAYSTPAVPFADETYIGNMIPTFDDKLLSGLMRKYPGGHLWSLDDRQLSSSEDDSSSCRRDDKLWEDRLRRGSRRKENDAKVVKAAFPSARQVLFAPLWDATNGLFAHGVFIVSSTETRSFNATSELSFLNSFCSTLMTECNRIDTMRADKHKRDFVRNISHEMRSPLHGVLASVELLMETEVTDFQNSLIGSIGSCGRTLLDTINHILDFSKINSLQKRWQAWNKKASSYRNHYLGQHSSLEAFAHDSPRLLGFPDMTDVATVLEEVVDNLVAGQTYKSSLNIPDLSCETRGEHTSARDNETDGLSGWPVNIIFDVQQADWVFMTQQGAIRRIIMNVTANAIKYTTAGFINIKLELEGSPVDKDSPVIVFTVTDTGRGMSPQFLSSKLFVPFTQENEIAPGTGLGLSIVHSIVTILGGSIDVKSKVGKGTTVQVSLPMKRPLLEQQSTQSVSNTGGLSVSTSSTIEDSIAWLRCQPADSRVTLYRREMIPGDELARVMTRYVKDWYHLELTASNMFENTPVIVVEGEDLESLIAQPVATPGGRPAIIVICRAGLMYTAPAIQALEGRINGPVQFVTKPCGPYKLARSLRLALEKARAIESKSSHAGFLDAVTEVPTVRELELNSTSVNLISSELQKKIVTSSVEPDAVQALKDFTASQTSHIDTECASKGPGATHQDDVSSAAQGREQGKYEERNRTILGMDSPGPLSLASLPTPEQTAAATSMDERAGNVVESVDPHVLLVDDNTINLKLLETFLKIKRKYANIKKAENGKQAIDAVMAAKEPFQIIFMDISMPVMDGFEATRAIREYEERVGFKSGAMVIALTGLASERDQMEIFESGCDHYMAKPASFKEIAKLLDDWEMHQRLQKLHTLAST